MVKLEKKSVKIISVLIAVMFVGGVVALAEERIFGTTEIATLTNFDRLPFVFTATCEFSKYDNPLLLSAGILVCLTIKSK